jgi:hypothetical protein
MKDLLALATIRRLLLELDAPLGPEVDGTLVGPLERWMHEPREDLGGVTPLSALSTPEGVDQVRQSLRRMSRHAQHRGDAPAGEVQGSDAEGIRRPFCSKAS